MCMTNEVKAILHLTTTCGEACWYAREDVCKCSCGGKNHGILKTKDGKKPERTKHSHGNLYKLVAVTDYKNAYDMVTNDYGSFLDKFGYSKNYPSERMIYNKASESQLKWTEVLNITLNDDAEKYLVWEKSDTPKYW